MNLFLAILICAVLYNFTVALVMNTQNNHTVCECHTVPISTDLRQFDALKHFYCTYKIVWLFGKHDDLIMKSKDLFNISLPLFYST